MSETATGPEIRCEAGQPVKPTRFDCRRHPKHWWCRTCAGWYGVPHKGLHPHPRDRQCDCRVCKDWFWEPRSGGAQEAPGEKDGTDEH